MLMLYFAHDGSVKLDGTNMFESVEKVSGESQCESAKN